MFKFLKDERIKKMKKIKVLGLFLALLLFVGLTACGGSSDENEETVDTSEIEEVTEEDESETDEINDIEDEEEVETDNENTVNFQLLYDMTSEMMATLDSADATNMEAVIAAFEQTVTIADTVASNEAHSQLTRDLANVIYGMATSQFELMVDNQDEIPVDALEPMIQVAINNILESHVIFEQNLGE